MNDTERAALEKFFDWARHAAPELDGCVPVAMLFVPVQSEEGDAITIQLDGQDRVLWPKDFPESERGPLLRRIASGYALPTVPVTTGRVGGEWTRYRQEIVPTTAPTVQVQESQRAFYAGAWALWRLIMATDPGLEPTEADLKKMDQLHDELQAFAKAVGEGSA